MKRQNTRTLLLIIFLPVSLVLSAFEWTTGQNEVAHNASFEPLKEQAFSILDAKCNVCHRKQNPFMVFKLGNMDKRAERIYRAVFVQKRMPKGDDIRLTAEEYATLEQWLKTKIN